MTEQVKIVLGGGAFMRDDDDIKTHQEYLDILEKHGIKEIDTARIYGPSETVLGKLEAGKNFIISTKIPGFAPGVQSREKVFEAQKTSFEELKVDEVDVYFLHAPDSTTPIAETLEAMNELYKAGKFKRFGLSNFPPDQVEAVYNHAKEKGYVLPTVFQGNYNPVSRHVETRLFPTLRKLGISFWVYSALAGGFLSKSASTIESGYQAGGRWDPETFLGKLYQKLYNRPTLLEGLREWNKVSEETGISGTDLAYRYMVYHSVLDGKLGDAVIVGASTPAQLEQSLAGIEKGPLDKSIVDRLNKVWDTVEAEAPYDNLEAF